MQHGRGHSQIHEGERDRQFMTGLNDLDPLMISCLPGFQILRGGEVRTLAVYWEKMMHFISCHPSANPGRTRRNCHFPGRSLTKQLSSSPATRQDGRRTSPLASNMDLLGPFYTATAIDPIPHPPLR